MNTYLVKSLIDSFGSYEETTIKADYFSTSHDELTFVTILEQDGIKKYKTVAAFSKGHWSRVTEEIVVE